MGKPVRTSSLPAIRRIPRPPAAAPPAGGRGINGSRRVHSLGVRGVAAGGAAEEVARSESLLKTAALFFDLTAPVEFQAESVVLFVTPPPFGDPTQSKAFAVEKRRAMPAARASRWRRSWNPGQGPICIFRVFLDLSVRCLVNINITPFAKKKVPKHEPKELGSDQLMVICYLFFLLERIDVLMCM